MGKDPERIRRRAEEAAKLGLTEDELRQQRAEEDAKQLASKAEAAGVSVERYLADKRRARNQARRARTPAKTPTKAAKTSTKAAKSPAKPTAKRAKKR